MLKIVSWNVNGLRSCAKKGFREWLLNSESDIVGLQETRCALAQLPHEIVHIDGFHSYFSSGIRGGYSGVGLYTKLKPDSIETSLQVPEFDDEGRVIMAYFGKLCVVNVYFPNGQGKNYDNSRIPFKLRFYSRLFDVLNEKRNQGFRLVVMGDYNTAHTEIDLARPKDNQKTSGFCPEEREEITRWLANGYYDTFRLFNTQGGNYTWWSVRTNARERNVGWRIDYSLVCEQAKPFVKESHIRKEVFGSDHCPVEVWLDKEVMS